MTNEWPPPPGTPQPNNPPGGQPGAWNQPVPPGQPGPNPPGNPGRPNGPGYPSGPMPAQGQWQPGQTNPTAPIDPRAGGPGPYGPPPGAPYGGPPQGGPPQGGQGWGPPPGGPPQGGPGWGPPGGYPPGNGPVPLGPYGPQPPRKRGSKLPLMIALVLVVILGAAGTTYALVSGGDAEPGSPASATAAAEHIPDTSLMAMTLDLDPSNAEKVAMLNYLRSFPSLNAGSGTDSVINDFLTPLLGQVGDDQVSQDILPWLGPKMAVAALPGDGQPYPVGAIKVTDQQKAEQGLSDLAQNAGDTPVGWTFADGYVIISDSDAHAIAAAGAAAEHSLGADEGYRADIEDVADGAVLTVWGDLRSLAELGAAQSGADSDELAEVDGIIVGALSFESHVAELRFKAIGTNVDAGSDTDPIGPDIASLPEDSILAIGSSGVADADEFADRFEEGIEAGLSTQVLGGEAGDELEDAFETISQVVTLVSHRTMMAGDPENLGIVTSGGDPDESTEAATTVLNAFGVDDPRVSADGDQVAVATTSGYADTIRSGGGSLGETDLFKRAVPDAAGANLVAFADLGSILPTDQIDANAATLRAVGLTASGTELVIRLVV